MFQGRRAREKEVRLTLLLKIFNLSRCHGATRPESYQGTWGKGKWEQGRMRNERRREIKSQKLESFLDHAMETEFCPVSNVTKLVYAEQ